MKKLKITFAVLLLFLFGYTVTCYGENPWLIRINVPEFKLYLYHAEELYEKFDVAVGKQETPSPLGDFWIVNKVLDPTWYPSDGRAPVPPGIKNPLGKYWMGLNIEGYGIHGNSAAWSIGTPASLGCFRLHNDDIKKLFKIVPVGTPVQIVYETVHATIDQNNIAWIEVFPDIYKWNNHEAEAFKILHQMGWIYEPHWKALAELLQAKKPLKVEVPRTIKFSGETLDMDGFYWRQNIYISQKSLEALAISQPNNNMVKRDNDSFTGYCKIDLSRRTKESSQYIWDDQANTLRIIRPKILLNGVELSKSACFGREKGILVDLKAVATALGVRYSWDNMSKAFICKGVMISGEPRDGRFWVAPEVLTQIWGGLRYYYEPGSATLDILIE
jgi:L,D-transpeptidase ErfK/SrfK